MQLEELYVRECCLGGEGLELLLRACCPADDSGVGFGRDGVLPYSLKALDVSGNLSATKEALHAGAQSLLQVTCACPHSAQESSLLVF